MHVLLYIDPGGGSMLLQVVVGLIAGAGYFVFRVRRMFGDAISRLLGRGNRDGGPPSED